MQVLDPHENGLLLLVVCITKEQRHAALIYPPFFFASSACTLSLRSFSSSASTTHRAILLFQISYDFQVICSLSALRVLHLDCNGLADLPDSMAGLTGLEELSIRWNNFKHIPPVRTLGFEGIS